MAVKVGDRVKWNSQSMGAWKEKVGTVVMIIPSKRIMNVMWKDEMPEEEKKKFNFPGKLNKTTMRTEESYLIAVPTPSGKGRPRVYWPLVSNLKFEGKEDAKPKSKPKSRDADVDT